MKFTPALLASLSFAVSAFAQLDTLPASSLDDGVSIHIFSPATEPHWQSSDLNHYRVAADNAFPQPSNGWVDPYGVSWTNQAPSKTDFNLAGGTFRLISLGGSGDWLNAIGYSYSGIPADLSSYTLSYADGTFDPTALQFGDCSNISVNPGDAATFDFWLNTQRGAYSLFDPSNSMSAHGAAQVFWTHSPLQISTYLPAYDTTMDVDTWIVSLVESGEPGDASTHEFRFALQEVTSTGLPLRLGAVPEPSVYGLIASASLAGLAFWRHRRR